MNLLSFRPKGEILSGAGKISRNIRDDSDGVFFIDMDKSGRSRCRMPAMTFFLSLRGACFIRHGDTRIRYLEEKRI